MTLKEKKYTITWQSGETTVVSMNSNQAKNMRIVESVKSVTLIKKIDTTFNEYQTDLPLTNLNEKAPIT